VQRLLGNVEVTEQADERRQDAAGFGDIDGIHRLVHGIGHCHSNRSHHKNPLSLIPDLLSDWSKRLQVNRQQSKKFSAHRCSAVESRGQSVLGNFEQTH
jgi:hypothetical protein